MLENQLRVRDLKLEQITIPAPRYQRRKRNVPTLSRVGEQSIGASIRLNAIEARDIKDAAALLSISYLQFIRHCAYQTALVVLNQARDLEQQGIYTPELEKEELTNLFKKDK